MGDFTFLDFSMLGGLLFALLILVFAYSVLMRLYRGGKLETLILENDGTKASLSRFQLLLFTFVVAGLFLMLSIQAGQFVEIPQGVLALIGISGGSFLISKHLSNQNAANTAAQSGTGELNGTWQEDPVTAGQGDWTATLVGTGSVTGTWTGKGQWSGTGAGIWSVSLAGTGTTAGSWTGTFTFSETSKGQGTWTGSLTGSGTGATAWTGSGTWSSTGSTTGTWSGSGTWS